MSAALMTLADAYENPLPRLGGPDDRPEPVAVMSWPTVPAEIVRAAGLRPVVMRGSAVRTPLAQERLEAHVFPNRLHQLVEAGLSGSLRHAACVVLPRTSDGDYKAFLYLRELHRRHVAQLPMPVLLFDLLQSDGPEVRAYSTARTRALWETLSALGPRAAVAGDVRDAIVRANAARASVRRLLALRRGLPRVSGREVLPLIAAFWRLAPDDYAALANEAADVLSRRAPLPGPRVLLAGAPVDGPVLHEAIEAYGAVVVAETGPWGTEAAGDDILPDDDPFEAIAEHYRRHAIGPRTPHAAVAQHLDRLLDGIDAVVVSLPPDDAVFGWQYPALRAALGARRLPHICVTGDPCTPPTSADHERLEALLTTAISGVDAGHG